MKEQILITGASSGIGFEMARELAIKGFDLILVARRKDVLQQMKSDWEAAYQIKVTVIAKDLARPESAQELYDEITTSGLTVTGLINNAGFGNYGDFADTPLAEDVAMIQVNVSTLVSLTKLVLAGMKERRSGRIMNIASLLSFLPFPYYSVYSATKAFVLAFTETIAAELEGSGVTVTALCPGPIDTGFNTSEMLKTNAYKANKPMDPKVVATQGVALFLNGKGKKIVGFNNWFISNLPRVTPDTVMMKIKKNLASIGR